MCKLQSFDDACTFLNCKCADMRDANQPVSAEYIRAAFDREIVDLVKKKQWPDNCPTPNLVIRDTCAVPRMAVTCAPLGNSSVSTICFPRGKSRCDVGPLLLHELIHVIQFCQNLHKQRGTSRPKTIRELEHPAWEAECIRESAQRCETGEKRRLGIRACRKAGMGRSTKPGNTTKFEKLCRDLRNGN